MENFKESLKITSETKEALNFVEQKYKEIGRNLDFKDKIATAVYMAILDINTKNEKEENEKLEFMNSLNKIIYNYDSLKPIISNYFNQKDFSDIEK